MPSHIYISRLPLGKWAAELLETVAKVLYTNLRSFATSQPQSSKSCCTGLGHQDDFFDTAILTHKIRDEDDRGNANSPEAL